MSRTPRAFVLPKVLSVAIVGVGNVGAEFVRQLRKQRTALHRAGYAIGVVALANSRQVIWSRNGINLSAWRKLLKASRYRFDSRSLAERISGMNLPDVALVDCTASQDVVDAYPLFIKAQMHIVTPNKLANVLPWNQYRAQLALLKQHDKQFYFEGDVGAGLPIISTLNDLVMTGDAVRKIEGVLSGTLSFIFNQYDGTTPFSRLVKKALELGYTEPDPREDLSGNDVTRKLLILARQLGMKMDLHDVKTERLLPNSLNEGRFSPSFFDELATLDGEIKSRYLKAKKRGNVLRYVGVLQGRRAFAGLREFPPRHPFAITKGSESIFVFTTQRYGTQPLVIKGRGAGAEVTAMAVFSDVLKLLRSLH